MPRFCAAGFMCLPPRGVTLQRRDFVGRCALTPPLGYDVKRCGSVLCGLRSKVAAVGGQYPCFGSARLGLCACRPACRWGAGKGGEGTLRCPLSSFTSSSPHRLPFVPPRRADGDASHYFQGFSQQAEQGCCIRFRVPAFGALHECRDRVLFVRRSVGAALVAARLLGGRCRGTISVLRFCAAGFMCLPPRLYKMVAAYIKL